MIDGTGLTVMTVHAHPDDETTKGGGTAAWLAAQGVRTVLVCCTDGSAGDVTDPALLRDRPLADVRADELAASASILGYQAVHQLGHADSGTDASVIDGFAQKPLAGLVDQLAEVISRERPQVVITYDPAYAVGHPDHARCHEVAAGAFAVMASERAGPKKLYGTRTHSRQRLETMDAWLRANARKSPYRKAIEALGPDRFTLQINVGEHVLTARRALREHRTQVSPDEPWFYAVPDESIVDVYPYEDFELLATAPGFVATDPETDLLTGLLP